MVANFVVFALFFTLSNQISLDLSNLQKVNFDVRWNSENCRVREARACLCFKKQFQYSLGSDRSICRDWHSLCFDFRRDSANLSSSRKRGTVFDVNAHRTNVEIGVNGSVFVNGLFVDGLLEPFHPDFDDFLGPSSLRNRQILAKFLTTDERCQPTVEIHNVAKGGRSKREMLPNNRFITGRPADEGFMDNRVMEFILYEMLFVVLFTASIQLVMFLWYNDLFPFNVDRFPFNQLAYTQLQ